MMLSKCTHLDNVLWYYSFMADRMKSDTGGWVEYTKAMEEYS